MTPTAFEAAARGARHADSGILGAIMAGSGVLTLLVLGAMLLMTIATWRIFEKGGQPGWMSLVPVLQVSTLHDIVGRPKWWIILYFVPVINALTAVVVLFDLAKAFGKPAAYGLGLLFLPVVFFPMLAFGDAEYQGPLASGAPRPLWNGASGGAIAAALRAPPTHQQHQQRHQQQQQQQQNRGQAHILGASNGMSNAERLRQQMAAARVPASVSQQPLSAPPQSGAGGPIRGYRPKAS